jgi:predicted permease
LLRRENGSLLNDPEIWWVQVMGRLQPGIEEKSAQASLAVTLNQAVRATMVVPKDRTLPPLTLIPGDRGWLNYADRQLQQPSSILLALTGLVLLLACANIANLLLARSVSREREISVRLALGAGRARIVRQMLTESLLLSMLGGTAGLAVGYLGRNAIPQLLASKWDAVPVTGRFDGSTFAFTLIVSLISGFLFGVGPAWQATRSAISAGLKEGATTHTRQRGYAGKALVVFQVSLCMLLLVGAGLFVRTLVNLNAADTGFQQKGLLLFAIAPPTLRYPAPKNVEVLHEIEATIAALPGVESITLSEEPLLAQTASNDDFFPDGQPRKPGRSDSSFCRTPSAKHSLQRCAFQLLYGRAFDFRDTPTSPNVASSIWLLLAKSSWGRIPSAKRFIPTEELGDRYEIVGVSADAKYARTCATIRPQLSTFLYRQQKDARDGMTFEVRTKW